jgi:hypothetical protein
VTQLKLVIAVYMRIACDWWNYDPDTSIAHCSSSYISRLFSTLFGLVWEASLLCSTSAGVGTLGPIKTSPR